MKNSLLLGFVLFLIISIGFSTYLVQSPQVPGKFADELDGPVVDVVNDVALEEKTQELVVTEIVPSEVQTEIVVDPTLELSSTATPGLTSEPTSVPTTEPTVEPTLLPTEVILEPTTEPSLVPSTNPESKSCDGDVNGDGSVDFADVEIIKANFGQTTCETPGDIDNNCIVNIYDYGILLQNYACSKE